MRKPLLDGASPGQCSPPLKGQEARVGVVRGRFHPHPFQWACRTLSLQLPPWVLGCGGVKLHARSRPLVLPTRVAHRVLARAWPRRSRARPRGPQLETPVPQSHGKAPEMPGRAPEGELTRREANRHSGLDTADHSRPPAHSRGRPLPSRSDLQVAAAQRGLRGAGRGAAPPPPPRRVQSAHGARGGVGAGGGGRRAGRQGGAVARPQPTRRPRPCAREPRPVAARPSRGCAPRRCCCCWPPAAPPTCATAAPTPPGWEPAAGGVPTRCCRGPEAGRRAPVLPQPRARLPLPGARLRGARLGRRSLRAPASCATAACCCSGAWGRPRRAACAPSRSGCSI